MMVINVSFVNNITNYEKMNIEKLANTIIYLSKNVEGLTKEKLLQFLYILDEESIKEHGTPFLGLEYKVWKDGPINEELHNFLNQYKELLKNNVSN